MFHEFFQPLSPVSFLPSRFVACHPKHITHSLEGIAMRNTQLLNVSRKPFLRFSHSLYACLYLLDSQGINKKHSFKLQIIRTN